MYSIKCTEAASLSEEDINAVKTALADVNKSQGEANAHFIGAIAARKRFSEMRA